MIYRRLLLAFTGALALLQAFAGEPSAPRLDKNPKNPVPLPLPEIPLGIEETPTPNRFGVLATGGIGVEAKFVSDAFVKKDPTKKIPIDSFSETAEDDFSGGFEVFYERLFSDPEEIGLWGLRVALGYTGIGIEDRFRDAGGGFALAHDLDADLFHLNIGPFYEHRFTNAFFAQVSAGLTGAYINADLSTRDSTGLLRADASENEFLFGAYASLAIGYDIAPSCSLIGGVRYQYLDSFEMDNGSTKAELDFDGAVFAFIGLRFTF